MEHSTLQVDSNLTAGGKIDNWFLMPSQLWHLPR